MHPNKALGPDGMSHLFFQHHWHIIGPSITKALLSTLNTGQMPQALNHTFITLISKKNHLATIADYRPISLCNILYKLISKVLDNRLKVLLHCLISKSHSAFVPKRQIIDNILVAYEVIHFLKRKSKGNQGFFSLKLDMSKAHDWVEWDYLKGILVVLGFSINFFNLIMQCVKMAFFLVLVNGVRKEPIIPSRGLRQGDSFSLYIFLLCIDGIVNLLNYSLMEKSLKGINVCQGAPVINHLLFTDDSLIFWEATVEASNSLLKILDEYAHALG